MTDESEKQMNLKKENKQSFLGPSILSLIVFVFLIFGNFHANAKSQSPPEYSIRAFFEGHGWSIIFQGNFVILIEVFSFMLIPSLWLGITAIVIWKKPKTVLRTVLLSFIPLLWLLWAFIAAFPEINALIFR